MGGGREGEGEGGGEGMGWDGMGGEGKGEGRGGEGRDDCYTYYDGTTLFIYQSLHVLHNIVSQWHQCIYIYIKHVTYYVITHSVSTSHNNGTYYVRLDVESVRDTQ